MVFQGHSCLVDRAQKAAPASAEGCLDLHGAERGPAVWAPVEPYPANRAGRGPAFQVSRDETLELEAHDACNVFGVADLEHLTARAPVTSPRATLISRSSSLCRVRDADAPHAVAMTTQACIWPARCGKV